MREVVGSLKALLSGIVDYAGMFPPASLTLADALEHYANHRGGPYKWMLSRFICPAGKLGEIHPAELRGADKASPWRLAIIGRGGADLDSFLQALQDDLAAVREFLARAAGSAVVETFEVKLPITMMTGEPQRLSQLLDRSAEAQSGQLTALITLFLEIAVQLPDPSRLGETMSSIRTFNERSARRGISPYGVKIRTGGVEAGAFPTCEQVAAFIRLCREFGVAFKATAGLHHPLRHHDASIGTMMHGFLNVFVAAALAHALNSDLSTLVEVLESQKIEDFDFTAGGLRWRELEVSTQQVQAARTNFAVSYGSCSFDEPVQKLQELGLM